MCGGGELAAVTTGDRAFDLGVGVGDQVGRRDVDAVCAIRPGCARVGFVVDDEGNDVASREGAGDFAGNGDVGLPCIGGIDDVVASDGGNAERGFNGWANRRIDVRVDAVILHGAGGGAAGAINTAINGGIRVGQQIGGADRGAPGAVGGNGGGVGVAVDF